MKGVGVNNGGKKTTSSANVTNCFFTLITIRGGGSGIGAEDGGGGGIRSTKDGGGGIGLTEDGRGNANGGGGGEGGGEDGGGKGNEDGMVQRPFP
jgi:hypothetical protein